MKTVSFYVVRVSLIALLFLSKSAIAAEFTWFTDVQGREGWIEFSERTVAFQNRIHVFPRLGGPDGADGPPRVEARDDGVVVSMIIDSQSPENARAFTDAVLAQVVSRPDSVSNEYQIDVPRPRGVRVAVVRDGETLASREIEGRVGAEYVLQIKVPSSGDTKAALLRGDFQLQASFELPVATFSSININVDESAVVSYKVQALMSVTKSSRRSGGKFLFLDWRHQSARTAITRSINEQRSVTSSRETDVLTIDPDEAMIARVEALLGLAPLSHDAFVANHLRAAIQAEAAGDFDLAALHREYAAASGDPTPRVQTDLLEKAFAALGQSEPAIGVFLANGIQFSEGSTRSSSRYQGFGQTRIEGTTNNRFSEMKLTSALVKYAVSSGPFTAGDSSLIRWFGTGTPDEQTATTGLLRAVETGNMPMLLASLRFSAGYNAVYGMRRQTPLMMAAQRCNHTMVKTLLDAGANPFLRDTSDRRAAEHARSSGCPDVAALIATYE